MAVCPGKTLQVHLRLLAGHVLGIQLRKSESFWRGMTEGATEGGCQVGGSCRSRTNTDLLLVVQG